MKNIPRQKLPFEQGPDEDIFQRAADAIPHLAWIANPEGRIIWSNQRWFAYSGLNPDPENDTSWKSALPPDDAEDILRRYNIAISRKSPWEDVFPLRNARGEWRWFLARAEPVWRDDGTIIQWVGTNTDITDQRDSTKVLEEKEREQRFLANLAATTQPMIEANEIISVTARMLGQFLECSRCAYAEVDKDEDHFTVIGDYTDGVKSIVGSYALHDFGEECLRLQRMGKAYIVNNVLSDPRIIEHEKDAYKDTEIQSVICVPLLKRGRLIAAMAVHHSIPRVWSPREIDLVQRVVGLCWESLERTRITRDLMHSEERYKNLFDTIGQGFCIIEMIYDANGKPVDYLFVDVNPAFERHTGMKDAAGKTMREFAPDHEEYWFEIYDKVSKTGQKILFTQQASALNGRWYDLEAFRLSESDTRVAVLFSDITESRNAAQQIAEALSVAEDARDAAQAANRAKTDFLTNMSHEIRTPMNAVIGLTHILASSDPLTDRQRKFIDTLQTSAKSLMALLNDMLDLSRIESSSVEIETLPFSMSRLCCEVVEMMMPQAKQKGLDLSFITAVQDEPNFMGDPTRIRQILINLCGNAIKFTESGSVKIDFKCDMSGDPARRSLSVNVRDTGIGIPPDKLPLVFDKFVQADSSIARKYGGSGLGLAISKTLAVLMGGDLSVQSTSGQGSCFTFRVSLPIAANDGMPNAEITQTSESSSISILLVEDNEANILVAGTFLENMGYAFDVARSGEEALTLIKRKFYPVILMDVQMPGKSGLEVTRQIREEEQGRGSRSYIIGMTAHALAHDEQKCLSSGMDAYLSKPFNPRTLEEEIKKSAA